jgi:hypothetical protein
LDVWSQAVIDLGYDFRIAGRLPAVFIVWIFEVVFGKLSFGAHPGFAGFLATVPDAPHRVPFISRFTHPTPARLITKKQQQRQIKVECVTELSEIRQNAGITLTRVE